MSSIGFLLLPFLECLVLIGIHSYLGIHVLKRKVIFVDLALAQIAALGATVAFLFGINPDSPGAYVFSLLATFCAAAIFAVTRLRREKVPQEAIIGLTYAIAASVAILVVDRGPSGSEHIKDLMAGSILWVRKSDVMIAAAVYAAVGSFHWRFRDRFLLISRDPEAAAERGLNVRLWDFFFYLSFGLVISISVRTAGVLLVFVFLVAPAMLALLISERLRSQLLIGWGVGTLVSVLGFAASNTWDLPAGPAVVSLYGLVLVCAAIAIYLGKAMRGRTLALRRVAIGSAVVVGVGALFYGLGTGMASSDFWARPEHHDSAGNAAAAAAFVEERQRIFADEEAPPVATTADAAVKALADELSALDLVEQEERVAAFDDVALLSKTFAALEGDDTRLTLARRLYALSRRDGVEALAAVATGAKLAYCRSEALEILLEAVAGGAEANATITPTSALPHHSN